MATTVTAATLTVRVVESLVLGGIDYGNADEAVLSIASVARANRRTVRVESDTNGTELVKLGSSEAAGQYVGANLKYLRIRNLDDTNYVVLHLEGNSHYAQVKLEAGKSFILGANSLDNASDIDSFSAESITTIQAKANTADVDVEIFVATT